MEPTKLFALALFAVTYLLIIALPRYRPWVSLGSALLFVVSGILSPGRAAAAIDLNILLMLAGTMGTVSLFIESKMPNRMAELLLGVVPNVKWAVVAMSLFAGLVSAFVDNVATVLMLAPVGLAIAWKLSVSPIAMLICIAVSSNLQGAATLVGDTTSILLGGYAGMDFTEFFFLDGRPSIFFAVELGAAATIPVILFLFRDQTRRVELEERTQVSDLVPSWLLLGTILSLIAASFFPDKPAATNGVLCAGFFLLGCLHAAARTGSLSPVKRALAEIDYPTLLLLSSLFVVIAGISEAGIIDEISLLFVRLGGSSPFLLYTLVVWGSVAVSAFVDNIPYVATMLPVVSSMAQATGISATLLYFGLLSGATLGGNLTPIGASANITAIGILRRNGYEVPSSEFFRIGVPFTLCAAMAGYVYCWLVWA